MLLAGILFQLKILFADNQTSLGQRGTIQTSTDISIRNLDMLDSVYIFLSLSFN